MMRRDERSALDLEYEYPLYFTFNSFLSTCSRFSILFSENELTAEMVCMTTTVCGAVLEFSGGALISMIVDYLDFLGWVSCHL